MKVLLFRVPVLQALGATGVFCVASGCVGPAARVLNVQKSHYTPRTVAMLRETGYSMAFTAVRGLARPAAGARFELPRCDTRDVPGRIPRGVVRPRGAG